MLIFAKGGEPIKKECYDFPNFVEKIVIELLENQNISLAFNKTETDFIVYIDENMIRNATVNIISNSIEAFKINNIENREIKCDINIIDYFDKCKYSNHDKHVRIVIMDNAGGINNSVKDKILYPYFTTKSSSLGLGLTIVNSIIEKHEGYLYIDMGEQLKTISNIYIPIKKKVLSKTNKNEPSTQIYSTSNSSLKRILIMDDEEQILKMNKRFLELNGYFVEIALHGKEAIEKYKTAYENNNKFSVVILDLVIPDGMGGEETAVEILKIDKNSKLIVSSGYSNSNALSNFRNYGFISTLPKPYKLDELLDIINVVNNEEIL
jgi:CheY-like chemotaxis protein